jgi:hypothetical protein
VRELGHHLRFGEKALTKGLILGIVRMQGLHNSIIPQMIMLSQRDGTHAPFS